MKKLILIIALIAVAVLPMAARDKVTRDINRLPATAQTTIRNYFGKKTVNHIKIDKKTFGGADYDVIFNDGTEIDFDSDGNWTEIDCGTRSVPDGLVLRPIRNYVKTNFGGKKIVSIEVSRNKYEIELSNGVELEFDRSGNFKRADH